MNFRNSFRLATLLLAIIIFISCSEDKDTFTVEGIEDITGTWLLNEHGYSPGDRYITEAVPAVPPQIIRFHPDGKFSSNITGLVDFRFFEIKFDEQVQKDFLVLYRTADEASAHQSNHSYDVSFPDGQLRLVFRYCIEGCHMKFGKVEDMESDE